MNISYFNYVKIFKIQYQCVAVALAFENFQKLIIPKAYNMLLQPTKETL